MTLFTINHLDGTKSTRESAKHLRWAVVVYTPSHTRSAIRGTLRMIAETALDNIHRAVADGTVTERDGVTYVGGLQTSSEESLLVQWDAWLETLNRLKGETTDLYQATHWFQSLADAFKTGSRLQDEYDNTPWHRTVLVKPVVEVEDVPF